MSETLKPCPFCGGEASRRLFYGTRYGVYCDECDARVGGLFNTEAEAIAAWNVRAPVEHDGWFYLPKPKESIVQYGEQRTEKTEHGYKVTQPVEVIEGAIRSWSDELGEYIMKRICEAWSTSTHGTLTAEQVRKAVMSADRWEKPMGNTGLTNTHLIIRDDGWQAIADELNARAERTCECVAEYAKSLLDGKTIVLHRCSECHELMRPHMRYCPNCGRKVSA